MQHRPTRGLLFVAADLTAWPRPRAPSLAGRPFVHAPTPAVLGGPIVIGQPYSRVAWVAEPGMSWALPLDSSRLSSAQTSAALAAAQITRQDKLRADAYHAFWVLALDGAYGHLHFWQAVPPDARRGVVTRLRHDRVLFPRAGGLHRAGPAAQAWGALRLPGSRHVGRCGPAE